MIRLNGSLQDDPAVFGARWSDQFLAPLANLIHEHLFAAFRTPDEMIHDEMHVMFIVLRAHVDIPVAVLQQKQHAYQGCGLPVIKPCEHFHPHGRKPQRLYGLFCKCAVLLKSSGQCRVL
jgi:hypothetical protein